MSTPKEPKRPKVRGPSDSGQRPEVANVTSLGAAAHSKMEEVPSISSSTESPPTEGHAIVPAEGVVREWDGFATTAGFS